MRESFVHVEMFKFVCEFDFFWMTKFSKMVGFGSLLFEYLNEYLFGSR